MLADNGHEATSAGNAGVLRRAAAVNVDVDDDTVDVVGTAVLAEGIEVGAGVGSGVGLCVVDVSISRCHALERPARAASFVGTSSASPTQMLSGMSSTKPRQAGLAPHRSSQK